jgi:hypothetical protein
MTELESNLTLEKSSPKKTDDYLSDCQLSLSNIIYQVSIAKDGDHWCALIGSDLQKGIAGFGESVSEALHNLANEIENKQIT